MQFAIKTLFQSEATRVVVDVDDSKRYLCQLAKMRGYVVRNNYEFKHCTECGGRVYFVTFTFNDKALIQLDGVNYTNNTAFRELMINKVNKTLQRKYSNTCRYFLTCELGDGKGSRGYGRNPHFHVLFYVYPIDGASVIDPCRFMHLLRSYWSGENYEFVRAQDYKFGIVGGSKKHRTPSDVYGICVSNEFAAQYVCKYCVKDIAYDMLRSSLTDYVRNSLYSVLCGGSLTLGCVKEYYAAQIKKTKGIHCADDVVSLLRSFGAFIDLKLHFEDVVKFLVQRLANYLLPKTRCSNGLGIAGLDAVEDWANPKLPTIINGAMRLMPIPLYYFRKYFCTTQYYYKDGKKNVRYVKNSKWQDIQLNREVFKSRIERLRGSTTSYVLSASKTPHLSLDYIYEYLHKQFPRLFSVCDYHTSITYPSQIKADDILKYCLYKSVYFGRCAVPSLSFEDSPVEVAYADYCYFCQCDYTARIPSVPSYDSVPRFSIFNKYTDVFNAIELILLFYKYFKNSFYVSENQKVRETCRVHFAHDC